MELKLVWDTLLCYNNRRLLIYYTYDIKQVEILKLEHMTQPSVLIHDMYKHSDIPTGIAQVSTIEDGRLPLCVLYRPGGQVVITLE